MTVERPQSPNGMPPPAVTIRVLPAVQGQSIEVSHALKGGWVVAVQVLLSALQIAIAQERQEREAASKPPLIQLPGMYPPFRPERG